MSDAQGRFGIGVIGAGMGAKPHALALQSLAKDIAVLGVYRRDAAQRAAFCSTYGFPEAESYEALLADPRLDAVLVLTPPNAREAIVAAAAKAGKPVLLEKPVERTLAAAERIVALCDAAGVTLGVIFQHRFRRASRYLAEAVAENRYGRLEAVHLVVPWWRPQEGYYDQPGRGTFAQDGGGVLITQAIHSLDLMLSLCGEVSAVTAMAKTTRLHQMETEDFVSAGLEFANGAVGAVMATTASFPGGPESITLNFERASATLTAGNLTIRTMAGDTITEGEASEGGGGADPMAFPFDWHAAQIADFADAVRHGRQPVSTGHTALHVHRLIDAMMASAKAGKRVVVGA
ncbi:MAG: Gfo/Idh/MocA family oxidoreductase [Alphaproteobacteria bacterium]|nr:Gfo/Idh/MocA family oxidoreductase [Alphaproteobacteria bacterium]MBU1562564.1 Gfo/Idh/MocA family oxidoreductase [Alphaproteobacteria bacterium]MBU2303971.1 Gfo/Idh/MocA family oxidoreductase [Alphaproteobacteria bacterium]MBU2369034.1 Gfo/Idh/MocA family oxidoreductase [Alphaproteobacteria bacterium]